MHAKHSDSSGRADYKRMRDDFNELELEEQLTFLFESAAGTVARGLEEVVRTFSEGIDEAMRNVRQARRRGKHARKRRRSRSQRSAPSSGPGAAEPETSQRRAPRSPNRPDAANSGDPDSDD